jgi:hypothetical protein
MRYGATDDDLPVVGLDFDTLAIAKAGCLHDPAGESDG